VASRALAGQVLHADRTQQRIEPEFERLVPGHGPQFAGTVRQLLDALVL
jgi:hypothetical protein